MSKKVLKCGMFVLAMVLVNVFSLCAGAVIYSPTDDTFVDQWAPTAVRGSEGYLVLRFSGGWNLQGLVKFDLNEIAAGATITSATLNLYYYYNYDGNPVGHPLNVYRVTGSWDEDTTTWNDMPNRETTATCTTNVPGSFGWMKWDVTGDVQDFVDGTYSNEGWYIIDLQASSNMTYFRSKEYSDDPNYHPYLEVEVECTGEWGYHAGDIDKDCYVNFVDLAVVGEQWLWSSNPVDPCATKGEQTFIGAGFAFDGNDTTGPATILALYDDLNEGELEPEDIIVEYRGQPVANGEELLNAIQMMNDAEPGETIEMVIQRGMDVIPVIAAQEIHFETGMTCWIKCVNRLCVKTSTSGGESACNCQDTSSYDCWHRMSHILIHASAYTQSGYATASNECYNSDDIGNEYNHCMATVSGHAVMVCK